MPEISVIMAVYNAEETVGLMVNSILAQTFRDWELIAVDDGSTDRSGHILDSYAEKDQRIRVIHKPNGGVASARQAGIDNATGKYTIHADADDITEPKMLEDMYAIAKEDNSDIVIADFYTDKGGNSTIRSQRPETLDAQGVLQGLYTKGLIGSLWNKLIRRSVYEDLSIKFHPDINYCEDLLVLTAILSKGNPKISYLPKAYYHYIINDSSLTRNVGIKGLESMKKFHAEATKYLMQINDHDEIVSKFAFNEFLVMFTNRLYKDSLALKKEFLKIKPLITKQYGMRWRLGFWCIEHRLVWPAEKLIRL